MTKLILVRHGESCWNISGRYQGQLDIDLSERGQEQAKLVAQRLRKIQIDLILTSPLRRALDTAGLIASYHEHIPLVIDASLTEIGHGEWEGLTAAEVEEKFSAELALWQTEPAKVKMPGGESLAEVKARVFPTIQQAITEHPDKTILVCSHDAVLRLIILEATGVSLAGFWGLRIDNAAITVVEYHPAFSNVLALNDATHLGQLRSSLERQAL